MNENLPAPAAGAAQVTRSRQQSGVTVVRETARLLHRKWGRLTDMEPQDFLAMASLVHRTYPELGPAQVLTQFDLLGGSLYHNIEFYLDVANRDPHRIGPPRFKKLEPETAEWAEWVGSRVKPEDIAAAFTAEWDRVVSANGHIATYREANVCRMTDAVLYQGGKRDRGLLPDWEHVAIKTARTRALRRVLRFVYSPTEARQLYLAERLEQQLKAVRARRQDALLPAPGPVTRPDPPEPDLRERPISHDARRYLFGLLERYELGDASPHDALLAAIARVRGVESVETTKNLTWGELENVTVDLAIHHWPKGSAPGEEEAAIEN